MASIAAPTSTADPAPDENTDPLAAENSAHSLLQKRICPAASSLRLPLVRKRFLRETTMSATPQPRTPTGGHKMSVRVRNSPLPANLEVGKNTFRPLMNCSSSRISPKKDATGIRDSMADNAKEVTTPTKMQSTSPLKKMISIKPSPARAAVSTPPKATALKHEFRSGSPTKKPSSLSKNRSARKQDSDKSLFETPLKKGRPETPNHERPCSPVKRTIELDSPSSSVDMSPDLARNLVSHPNHLLRMLSGCLADATMDDDSKAMPIRRAIPNPSEYFTPIKKTRQPVSLQPKNISDLTANPGNNTTSLAFDWPFSPSVERNLASPTPTPLRKASEKLQLVGSASYKRMSEDDAPCASDVAARLNFEKELSSILPLQGLEQIVNMSPEVQPTQLLSKSGMDCFADKTQESHTSQYSSSYCPNTKRQRNTRADSGKQVEWHDASEDTSKSETQTTSRDEHVETSLSISLELEKDIDNAETTSSSIPNPKLCEPVNLSELLPIPNSDSIRDRQDASSSDTVGKSATLKKSNYNMSSLPRIKTNSPNKVALTKLPSKSTIPRCQSSGYLSAQAKDNRPIKTESPNLKSVNSDKTKGPASTMSHKSTKSITTPIKTASTLPRLTRTSAKQPSSRLPATSPWKLESPFATPPPPKRPLSLHITPKLASIPTLKQKTSTSKTPRPLSLVSPRKTPLPSICPDSYDTTFATLPRCSPTKVERAVDTTSQPKNVVPPQESTTPSTTPTLLLLPAPTPSLIPSLPSILPLNSSPTRPPRRRQRRPAALFIPVPAPAPALSPSHKPTHESTYLAPQDVDRNALRTPSKTILHSLDKAIDEKIAEDAARGVVVTAGGNRVRDLLEARGRRKDG